MVEYKSSFITYNIFLINQGILPIQFMPSSHKKNQGCDFKTSKISFKPQ
jgi:hypothetical protein